MNLKTLFTTIALLGSATPALARPITFDAAANVAVHMSDGSRTVGAHGHVVVTGASGRGDFTMSPGWQRPTRPFESHNVLTADASVYKGPLMLETPEYSHPQIPTSRAWLAVTAPTRIERGRQYVTDLGLRPTSRVRLAGVQGWTHVSQVLIRFTDGSEQVVHLDRRLTKGNSIDIEIGKAKAIHGFVLYGETSKLGAYQILVR